MIKILKVGDLRGKPDQMGDRIYSTEGLSPTLAAQRGNNSKGSVLITTGLIQPQSKKLEPKTSQSTIFSLEDSPANHSQSQEKDGGLKIHEALYSFTLPGSSNITRHAISYLKMLKDFSLMTLEELSKPSSPRLLSWGMISNGKCLTARISESPRIGKECSLSDILEEHPDQKYFLSEEATKWVMGRVRSQTHSPQIIIKEQREV